MAVIVPDARASLLKALPLRGIGAEVGVWRGDFSRRILSVAQPTLLHLIDPWQAVSEDQYASAWYGGKTTQSEMDANHSHVCERFADPIAKGRISVHRKGGVEALAEFEPDSLDYVYVDGDHTYEAVLADLRAALRVVRTGGFIGGDDYSLGGWWKDGVVRGFHQFLADAPVVIQLVLGTQFLVQKI